MTMATLTVAATPVVVVMQPPYDYNYYTAQSKPCAIAVLDNAVRDGNNVLRSQSEEQEDDNSRASEESSVFNACWVDP